MRAETGKLTFPCPEQRERNQKNWRSEFVGQAADGQEGVELARQLQPDVNLMDMSMPKLNGIDATRAIHESIPDIRIIGLSMFEEPDRAQALLAAGGAAYLRKSGSANTLLGTTRKAGGRQEVRGRLREAGGGRRAEA